MTLHNKLRTNKAECIMYDVYFICMHYIVYSLNSLVNIFNYLYLNDGYNIILSL